MLRREASTSRLPTFMLGPETVTQLMGRLAPRTTDPTTEHLHMRRRVMCPRDRFTEHPPSLEAKAMDQCIRRARPTLTSPICMRRNFRRGRPPLCPTTTGRAVATIKPMVGWDTVTDICRDRGRISGEPSFVFLGAMRVQQSATAVCAAIRKSDVMTQASLWPRRRHAHSSMSALRSISTDAAGFTYHSMSAHARKRPDYCAATK